MLVELAKVMGTVRDIIGDQLPSSNASRGMMFDATVSKEYDNKYPIYEIYRCEPSLLENRIRCYLGDDYEHKTASKLDIENLLAMFKLSALSASRAYAEEICEELISKDEITLQELVMLFGEKVNKDYSTGFPPISTSLILSTLKYLKNKNGNYRKKAENSLIKYCRFC